MLKFEKIGGFNFRENMNKTIEFDILIARSGVQFSRYASIENGKCINNRHS